MTDAARAKRALQDLRIAFEIVTERIARAARLNPRDLSVLDVLHAGGPATPTAIAERIGIQPTTLTAILARLERDGRIVRRRTPEDARSSTLAIAEATVRELDAHFAGLDTGLAGRFARLSAGEREVVVAFLEDVAAIVGEAPPTGGSAAFARSPGQPGGSA